MKPLTKKPAADEKPPADDPDRPICRRCNSARATVHDWGFRLAFCEGCAPPEPDPDAVARVQAVNAALRREAERSFYGGMGS